MHLPTEAQVIDYGVKVVALCSVLHSALPPVSEFNGFPTLQKYYTLFVKLVGYVAINWRGQTDFKTNGTSTSKGDSNVV